MVHAVNLVATTLGPLAHAMASVEFLVCRIGGAARCIPEHASLQSRTERDQAGHGQMEERAVPEAVELNKHTLYQMEAVCSEN